MSSEYECRCCATLYASELCAPYCSQCIMAIRAEIAALKAERDRALEILSEVPSMLSVFHTSPCPGWNLGKDCDACRIALFGQQASKPAQEGKS